MIVPPPTVPCRAPLLLAQMREATGGEAWQRIAEIVATGPVKASGSVGSATLAADRNGRYAQWLQIAAVGSSAKVYDGVALWAQDISGGVHPLDAPFARKRAVTDAYLARDRYLLPNDPAVFSCLGTKSDDKGQSLSRLRVTPRGGISAVLSIDAQSHLVVAASERLPTTTSVTRYADYREVGGVALPFSILSGTQAEPADGYAMTVRHYFIRTQTVDDDFAKPLDLNPPQMLGGARSTTVPVKIEGRQLLVWASIDGHPAMPFILDTGGHAILTPQAARSLGLHPAGSGESGGSGARTVALQYAPVASVRIGDAELRRQTFLVIDYPYSFYERGQRQPLAGILGLEVFERFAARIDYGRNRLTLTRLSAYRHGPPNSTVPICFQEDMPLAPAAADGYAGLFGIDTGNAGSLVLFGAFIDRTGLAHIYRGGTAAQGHGTGGADYGRIVALKSLTFDGTTYSQIRTFLAHMSTGSFSSWTEAGNFGYEILSRVVPTFDYARGVLYLDCSPFAHAPPPNRAGLIADKDVPNVFKVERVTPGSPAAVAGIAVGDSIVAIDGKPATQFSYGDLYDLVTARAGSRLQLRLMHGSGARDTVLVLR